MVIEENRTLTAIYSAVTSVQDMQHFHLSLTCFLKVYFPRPIFQEFCYVNLTPPPDFPPSRSAHDIELHRKRAGWTWDFFLEYINLSALYKDDYSESKIYDFLLLNNSLIQPLKITIS